MKITIFNNGIEYVAEMPEWTIRRYSRFGFEDRMKTNIKLFPDTELCNNGELEASLIYLYEKQINEFRKQVVEERLKSDI